MSKTERQQKIETALAMVTKRFGKLATPEQRAAIERLVGVVEGLREDYGDRRTSEMLDEMIAQINQRLN